MEPAPRWRRSLQRRPPLERALRVIVARARGGHDRHRHAPPAAPEQRHLVVHGAAARAPAALEVERPAGRPHARDPPALRRTIEPSSRMACAGAGAARGGRCGAGSATGPPRRCCEMPDRRRRPEVAHPGAPGEARRARRRPRCCGRSWRSRCRTSAPSARAAHGRRRRAGGRGRRPGEVRHEQHRLEHAGARHGTAGVAPPARCSVRTEKENAPAGAGVAVRGARVGRRSRACAAGANARAAAAKTRLRLAPRAAVATRLDRSAPRRRAHRPAAVDHLAVGVLVGLPRRSSAAGRRRAWRSRRRRPGRPCWSADHCASVKLTPP